MESVGMQTGTWQQKQEKKDRRKKRYLTRFQFDDFDSSQFSRVHIASLKCGRKKGETMKLLTHTINIWQQCWL